MSERPERPEPDEGQAGEQEPPLGADVPHREHSVDEEAAIERRRREEEPEPRE